MTGQHVAGLPVEELVVVALASAAPLLAYLGWGIADRAGRFRRAVRRFTTRRE
jgi:hypothetical protein